MADSPEAIKKSIKVYLLVFGTLCVCTVLTVAVATVPALDVGGHGFDMKDMWLGLAIASFKAFLVVPLVGAFFVDIMNAVIIKFFLGLPMMQVG